MSNTKDCEKSNIIVFLKKIDILEERIKVLEKNNEHFYDGLEKLFEKIEEMEIKK